MNSTTCLAEDWIDVLPDEIDVDARTQVGDLIVFEWRVENDREVPGAWIVIDGLRWKSRRAAASWNYIGGEALLSLAQHRAFLRGQVPRPVWPAPFECPVTLRLAPDFDLTIEGLEHVRKAGFAPSWIAERLTIRDLRPEPMLRAGVLPSVGFTRGHDDAIYGPTSVEIEMAAIESAYTRDPTRSADREVSAILPDEAHAVSISRAEVYRNEKRTAEKRIARKKRMMIYNDRKRNEAA